MKLKFIIKKILYSYKSSSKTYVDYLRSIGVLCGDNINIFCPKDTHIDTNNPYLLEIGNNVNMTGPVTILTHDYSTSVLNRIDSKIYGKSKKTVIGNNVFLGWGCTVLAGTVIEDNVIIGAGAVVSGKVEKNSIYAGNPAKKIMSISEYRKKIICKQKDEAFNIYKSYRDRFNKIPDINVFHEYFYLFTNDYDKLTDRLKNKLSEENIMREAFENNVTEFKSYEDFIDYCNVRYSDK